MELSTLHQNGELIATLEHENIKDFLMESMKKGTTSIYNFFSFYMMFFLSYFIINAGFCVYHFITQKDIMFILPIGIGVLVSFLVLIFVHEIIHAIAYYIVGGKNIYFGADLKKFVFYAASDKIVYNGIQFYIIAISPFIIINIVCLIAFLFYPSLDSFYVTILAFHSLFCSGDFAFLNFISKYNLKDFYTYDDRVAKKSYYYLMS